MEQHDFDTEVNTEDVSNIRGVTSSKKYRRFVLTIWDIAERDKLSKWIEKNHENYLVSGTEIAPKTGRIHYQTFIYVKNTASWSRIIKLCPTSYCRPAKYGIKPNKKYCTKSGDFIEIGNEPEQGVQKIDPDELIGMSDRDIAREYIMTHKTLISAKNILTADIDIDAIAKNVKVYYIQGPSGCGKTEKAKQIVRDNQDVYGRLVNFVKYQNTFWLGLGDAQIGIYDEFRDSHLPVSEFINFIDYNTHIMNIKNGSRPNKYGLIIITSVMPIDSIYSKCKGEPRLQWMRRIEVIDMFPNSESPVEFDFLGGV